MAPEVREGIVNVRMSPMERRMLTELAELDGLTVSEYIRAMVRKDHETRFGRVLPKPKKRTK